jgi:hypothetical protein
MRSIIASLAVSFLAVGCADEAHDDGELHMASNPTATYRVVVAFTSLGAGVDEAAYDNVLAAAAARDIDVTPELLLRLEGEKNLCFTLRGLNANAQGLFVDEIEGIVQSAAPTVNVLENTRCDLGGE